MTQRKMEERIFGSDGIETATLGEYLGIYLIFCSDGMETATLGDIK